MRRLRDGDDEALEQLLARYSTQVVNLARRMLGDREAAEDIAQEAFVRVYLARDRFRLDSDFRVWLFRIVGNLCRNELRRRGRKPVELAGDIADRAGTLPHAEARPDRAAESEQLRAAIQDALQRLPENQRQAVLLRRYEGLSYAEIGQVLGCSEGAVDGLLSRARSSLRDYLAEFLEE